MIKKLFFIIIYLLTTAGVYTQVFQQWVNRSDSISANYIAVSSVGNIYIAGTITGDNSQADIIVFCLSSSGELIWESVYEGIDGFDDIPSGLVVTRSGKVFVGGYSKVSSSDYDLLLIKFGFNGSKDWFELHDINGRPDYGYSISGNDNEVWLTGEAGIYPGPDCVTLLYNANTGNILQELTYGDSLEHVGYSVTSDKIHAYVAGYKYVNLGNPDYMTIRYNDAGQQMWVKLYNGPAPNDNDIAHSIALDTLFDYCYVTGESGTGLNTDITTLSYDEFGNQRWVRRSNGPGNYIDVGKFVTVDKFSSVIVTGTSTGTTNQSDITTIKYDRNGNQLWLQRYNGPANDHDRPNGLAVDDSGNVYITGETEGPGVTRYVTLKYNSAGVLQWTQFYEFTSGGIHYASCIALDRRRNVYVSGLSQGPVSWDAATIKYAHSNNTTKNFRKHSLNKFIPDNSFRSDTINLGGFDIAGSTLIDVDVIIDTIFHPNVDDLEITLQHFGITDTLIFRSGGSGDNFIDTYLDDGASYTLSSGTAPFTEDFKPHKSLNRFNGLEAAGDWILTVYDKNSGNTGILEAWCLVITALTPIGIEPVSNITPTGFLLHQNYPNPFNPVTNIRFEIPETEFVKLIVFDILGREIESLVNQQLRPSIYEVQWNSGNFTSGVYFYKLTSENYSAVKKMIVVK
jgi:hypothetical protein